MALKRSWIDAANNADCPFPLNNLPYGRYLGEANAAFPCVAVGDQLVDLQALERTGLLALPGCGDFFQTGDLKSFMKAGEDVWLSMRQRLQHLLAEGSEAADHIRAYLCPLHSVQLTLPFDVVEYTDFYASRHHATNVGTMFRGAENALPLNWRHMPIGYNGRASSVVASETPIRRPFGQVKRADEIVPRFAPSERFDFELELGAVVGRSSEGRLSVDQAFENIFGYVLLNDWSARDIQAWEYQPLGPFQSKATATTLSPWIVTAAALEAFRVPTPPRDVALLPHLQDTSPMLYDIDLEVGLTPDKGRETTICRTNYREMYYSSAQQLAHHTSSGCPMHTGDLLGSGTISGPRKDSRGCMLELSWGGQEPVTLDCGQHRAFLEDGDTITLRGAAKGDEYCIGFGTCSGKILPAQP